VYQKTRGFLTKQIFLDKHKRKGVFFLGAEEKVKDKNEN
jgi:hypothetical protein